MAARSTAKIKPFMGGDLLVHMESQIKCLYPGLVINAAQVTTLQQIAGYPVDFDPDAGTATLLLAAGQANTNALLLAGPIIVDLASGATTVDWYTIIGGGPVVVNENKIATNDVAGSAFTLTTLKSNLASAMDIKFIKEPVKQEVQTA